MRKGILSLLVAAVAGTGSAPAQTLPDPAAAVQPGTGWGVCSPGYYMPIEPPPSAEACAPPCEPVHVEHERPLGPRECWWINGAYLLWRVKNAPIDVPLATTTSLAAGTGILGDVGTSVVLGSQTINLHEFSGGQVAGGFWFDPYTQCLGMEATGFMLGKQTQTTGVNSNALGTPPLFVPFVDITVTPPVPSAFPVAVPGAVAGGVNVTTSSRMSGGEIDFIGNVVHGCKWRLLMLAGFDSLDLTEDLTVSIRRAPLSAGTVLFDTLDVFTTFGPGSTVTATDFFQTRNQFYGGEGGMRLELYWWRFYFDLDVRLALGVSHETLNVLGFTTLSSPLATFTLPGGFFAVPGNSGRFEKDELSGASRTELKVGMDICHGLSAFAGYQGLYWTNVARPGQQISTLVDRTQVPQSALFAPGFQGPPSSVQIQHTSFWAQGVDLGIMFRY